MANWRKVVGWTAVTFGALLLLVIVTAIVVLENPSFHRYLLAKIEQQAGEATGARIDVQNLQLHPKTLTADIYGLTVHGTERPGEKPLLQVEHLRIGLRIISILRYKVNLSELLIDHPSLNLFLNADGRSNLPQPPSSQNKSSTNVFDLA